MNESNILSYETNEGKINVDVILKDETIWFTQKSMSELFECSTDNIGLHLKNIYNDQELDIDLTTEKFSVVRKEGNRNVKRELEFYNLDAIIAVGYRVNSKKATQFRIWATKILKDSGKISHKKALEKADLEYEKFRIKQDKEYISSMDEMYKRYIEEINK